MSRTHGRHELGQNFLHDHRIIESIVDIVRSWDTSRRLIELGAGGGALTAALAEIDRPMTAVEIDRRRADALRSRVAAHVRVVRADLLDYPLEARTDVVSNVPYGITTPLLRRLLGSADWQHALLLVQWEVARKRAGVGGTTMMTAQWWPWFRFDLVQRVPARAFRPAPSVDGGILHIKRRSQPLVPLDRRAAYQQLVGSIFAGRGRGAADIVRRQLGRGASAAWAGQHGISPRALPRDLVAEDWVGLFEQVREGGPAPRRAPRRTRPAGTAPADSAAPPPRQDRAAGRRS